MAYTVTVQQIDAIPLAAVRRRAGLSQLSKVVPEACGEVWNFVQEAGIPKPGRLVAVYFDGVVNLEVGVEVSDSFQGDGTVEPSATPGGLVASTVHFGPYNVLGQAHQAIRGWIAANQYEIDGPNWEIYGHWTDDPAQLRTDVYYRVRAAGQGS
jgi:effector-binding domain-containing protein